MAKVELELFTEVDAIRFLEAHDVRLTVFALRSWRCAQRPDQPKYVKVGRKVFYRREDLKAWLRSERACRLRVKAA